jgi:hypothetical protein
MGLPIPHFLFLHLISALGRFIETRDQGAEVGVRPWVWIALIFLGPVVGTAVVSLKDWIDPTFPQGRLHSRLISSSTCVVVLIEMSFSLK